MFNLLEDVICHLSGRWKTTSHMFILLADVIAMVSDGIAT